ncbi:MAG TPA: hypothetical protein DCL21_01470 [Alphaproteobacteria bacterium]|nr:hypothetical protein [Alphaproteobacteria bacterium]
MATYSEALKEAYASVPTDTIVYSTLEIRHPHFSDEEGNPMSIYLVRDCADLEATIEQGHPIDSGKLVTFKSCPFGMPKLSKEPGVIPQVKITIDNISGDINKHLEMAVSEEIPIKVIYREYINKDLTEPSTVPLVFEIKDTDVNPFIVVFTCKSHVFTDVAVPSVEYTSKNFPNLVQ